jgi:hypothetical protein
MSIAINILKKIKYDDFGINKTKQGISEQYPEYRHSHEIAWLRSKNWG